MSIQQPTNIIYYITHTVPILIDYMSIGDIHSLKKTSHEMVKFPSDTEIWKKLIYRDYKVAKIKEEKRSINIILNNNHVVSFPEELCNSSSQPICYNLIYCNLFKLF